ncbi:MAG TPA: DMT family transporter [Terracidiphilus sp.]|jgi:drug/metabolite transporter (DMT)-like permease|nr:DMT family transporter [Terracidiphilus sp.]
MKLRAYILMTLVVAVWGSTFVVIKGALNDATPVAFNLIRMTLAFVLLAAGYHRAWKTIRRRHIAAGAMVGLCLAAGYQFQTIGLVRTTPSKSAFITGLVVVLVPLFSIPQALRPPGARSPRWNAFVGAALAFVGIVLITAPPAASALGSVAAFLPDFSSINIGDVLTLGCSISFAFHCIALGHTSPRIPFQPLAILQVGFCALFMAVSLPLIEHPRVHLTRQLVFALIVAAALATAAAFSIQSWAQSILPTTPMALILALEPVFAWITSFVVTGERLGMVPAIGAILILAGIALTELLPQPHVPTAHEA